MLVAIFKVNNLGDNIVFLPVIEELCRVDPSIEVLLFTTPIAISLYRNCSNIVHVVPIQRWEMKGAWKNPPIFLRLIKKLHQSRPAASLLSYDQGSVPHFLARCCGGRFRVGSAHINIRLPHGLTHQVLFQPGESVADWNWEMGRTLSRVLGLAGWSSHPPPPKLDHLIKEKRRTFGRPTVLIHPGASREYQRWPIQFFFETAELLLPKFDVRWIESTGMQTPRLHPEIMRVTTNDIEDLVTEISNADLFLGNNSGPMHIASALSIPSVVVTGPSFPGWDPVWHREKCVVLRRNDIHCQPCDSMEYSPDKCMNEMSPLACLKKWDPGIVAQLCSEQLRKHAL